MKKSKKLIIFISCAIIMLGLMYLGPAYYYAHNYSDQKCFLFGTYINGVYCTGLSIDEALDLIPKDYKPKDTVMNINDRSYIADMSMIGYETDYKTPLTQILNSQNP
ncbi:MAG: hypothetical protein ILN61_03250 [Lachnospiraceae bacterium]|nr:hypothetical protein [Lachnospiraceae bacterium]